MWGDFKPNNSEDLFEKTRLQFPNILLFCPWRKLINHLSDLKQKTSSTNVMIN